MENQINAHEHNHNHEHSNTAASPEETLALLEYMLGHNRHHAEDLKKMAENTPDAASEYIRAAVVDFEKANEKLEQALKQMKGE